MRGHAERAEHQADAYRAELDRLRASAPTPNPPVLRRSPCGVARAARPPSPGRRPINEPYGAEALEHRRPYLPGSYSGLENPEDKQARLTQAMNRVLPSPVV